MGGRSLAAALYHVLERPAWAIFGVAAALGGSEFLEMRVEQLESGQEPSLVPVPLWASAVTVAGLGLLSAAFVLAVARSGAGITMMGDGHTGGEGFSAGAGSAVLGLLGGVVCSLAGAALLVVRPGIGHNRLTLRSRVVLTVPSSTTVD